MTRARTSPPVVGEHPSGDLQEAEPEQAGRVGHPPERSGLITAISQQLPHGNTLSSEEFGRRHRLVCGLLVLHIPGLYLFGLVRGYDPVPLLLEMAPAVLGLAVGSLLRPGRGAAWFITAGLVYCSASLVHLSGGMIEAHFHFFILIGFIALYQDWIPFLWNVFFVVVSHGLGSALVPDMMYDHHAAQTSPWVWAGIHGVSVLFACVGVIIFWHYTEEAQKKGLSLAKSLAEANVATAAAEASRRESISALLIHLARRNQLLLDRQIGLLVDLEQGGRHPDEMAELFKLDHLATRMRRNAESLLVLSGSGSSRRWGGAVPLVDVGMAAAAEVEDYNRVEVAVGRHIEVAGTVVADLTHILAELIENATAFSPPTETVRVDGYLAPDGAQGARFVLSVEDRGVGMGAQKLAAVNATLSEAPEVDSSWTTLGHHVVARLARRHGLSVRMVETPGGGATALVRLPDRLIREGTAPATAPAPGPVSESPYSTPTLPPVMPAGEALARPLTQPSQVLEAPIWPAGLDLPGE